MKVSGFTFIRDGVRLGYPFVESILSALPICDEFVIACGAGTDGTRERLAEIDDPKLRIIDTQWNENITRHGFVYGQQKMLAQYCCDGDWAFYLEGDEVLHEDQLPQIRQAMLRHLDDHHIEALTFDYYHFHGDQRTIYAGARFYRKAARIIRNSIRTIAPDGLYWAVIKDKTWFGGRNKRRTRYPRAAETGAHIFHYGNCRHSDYRKAKSDTVSKFWSRPFAAHGYGDVDPQALAPFTGEHPAIIADWLREHANPELVLNPDFKPDGRDRKHRLTAKLEKAFGWDLSKRHFKLLK